MTTTPAANNDTGPNLATEDRLEQRDKGVLLTIYFCESCNMVLDLSDPEAQQHKIDKPSHKMRRVQVVRCAHCGQIVTDAHAQYSVERGQFWCKNCVHGRVEAFHTP